MSYLDKLKPINTSQTPQASGGQPSYMAKLKPISQEIPVPKKSFGEKVSNTIQTIFPGKQVGQAIGTLAGYVAAPKEQKQYYDLSAPTPLQVAGDVAQGALMLGAGGLPKPTTAISKVAGLGSKALSKIAIPTAETLGKRALTNTAIGAGFGGTGAIAEGKPIKDVATQTAIGGGLGLGLGLVGEGISKLPKLVLKSENIMNRVARTSPAKQANFKRIAGETQGEYLTKRGIFGDEESVMQQLYNRFSNSKGEADAALSQLPGNYKSKPLKTALTELVAREKRVSSAGAPSPDLAKALILNQKHNTTGLTMSEINEAKRLYERNIRLDFVKQNLPEGVARATNIDNALREWQFQQAEKLGLKNLPEINKETRLAKQLLDDLGRTYSGRTGNDVVNLSDWILLSGGDPTAVGGFLVKKLFSDKGIQSSIAKKLAGKSSVGEIKAVFGEEFSNSKPLQQPLSKIKSQTAYTKTLPRPKSKSIGTVDKSIKPSKNKGISTVGTLLGGAGVTTAGLASQIPNKTTYKASELPSKIATPKRVKLDLPTKANTVGDYNFSKYASNKNAIKQLQQIYSQMQDVSTPQSAQAEISRVSPNSPVTGEMIINAAKEWKVDPKIILTVIRNESDVGTSKVSRETNNPGNILNTDDGAKYKYPTVEEGIRAVARELQRRKLK